jgi:nucleoside-diphosphate-sugar epimerase
MADLPDLQGKRILVTGVTGMVAAPVAESLAAGNTVYGAARLKDPAAREGLEAKGITPVPLDLLKRDFSNVPSGLDYVFHFAVTRTGNYEKDLAANAEASADLMELTKDVTAFFHCSSTAVYEYAGHEALTEDAPLGDSHRPMGLPTYSISKIATEVLVRYTARRLQIPTVIARLNVPYGDTYGWPLFHVMMMERDVPIPVHPDQPSQFAPIHSDDIVASLPYFLSIADPSTPVVNWGGEELVSIEEWCEQLGEWTGLTPTFDVTTQTLGSVIPDLTKQHDLGFKASVGWKDGFRRMISTSRPDLYKGPAA